MSVIIILLAVAAGWTDMIKLSLLPKRDMLTWYVVWIVFSYFITLWLSSLPTSEILGFCSLKDMMVFGFIELILFLAYLFYRGIGNTVLYYYPGLLIPFSIAALSFAILHIMTGVDFKMTGVIVSGIVALILAGASVMLRSLKDLRTWLYISSVINLIIFIMIYGIL